MRHNFHLRWCIARLIAAIAILAVAVPVAVAGTPGWPSKRSVDSVRQAVTECTNRDRVEHGLRPLRSSSPLELAAQLHAKNMLKHGFFSHDDVFGRDPFDRIDMFQKKGAFTSMGENIAAGYRTGQSACQTWLRSSKHHKNILNRRFTHLGVGFANGDSEYGTYFVQTFGGGLH